MHVLPGSFIRKVAIALREMHTSGIAHNDVRLPNICFDDTSNITFIDLDRATVLTGRYSLLATGMGCMYDEILGDSSIVDMVQLGWMVAWVLTHPNDVHTYHTRKWDTQPPIVKGDKFVEALVKEGRYSEPDLDIAGYCKESIQEVLLKRKRNVS